MAINTHMYLLAHVYKWSDEKDNSEDLEMKEDDNRPELVVERGWLVIQRGTIMDQEQSMESFEVYLRLETGPLLPQGRKRKYNEVDISSNSNSPEDDRS